MNQSEQNYFSVQKPLETSTGPYTSPPPIGYPTRDVVVGDPLAAAVETKSKDFKEACGCITACVSCLTAVLNLCNCLAT